jgi:hypothetical protein
MRPDGSSTRSLLELKTENLTQLPEPLQLFWSTIERALRSEEVKHAIFNQLGPDLAERFKIPLDEVAQIEAYPSPALFCDSPGYSIKPHPDVKTKIVTTQFYFPADRRQEDLGTSLYVLKRAVLTRKSYFERVHTFPFLPNSVYGFAVSNHSFHGRDIVRTDAGLRHSLLNIYYNSPDLAYT